MQNAYASPGGYLDLAGFDIEGSAAVIDRIALAVEAARKAGVQVVFFQNGWDAGLRRGRRPGLAQLVEIQRAEDHARPARAGGDPAGQGHLGLRPGRQAEAADRRHRHPQAALLGLLQHRAGFDAPRPRTSRTWPSAASPPTSASRVTLRDGYHLEYFGVLLEDATHQAGPAFLQEASVYNVEKFFGWVSNTADFCGTISQAPPGS